MTKKQFKEMVMEKIKEETCKRLETLKQKHTKIAHIVHDIDKSEEYLTSNKFADKTSSLIFNLRSRCEKSFKDNFQGMHTDNLCPLCRNHIDSQELALSCEAVAHKLSSAEKDVRYSDLFGAADAQLRAAKLFQKLLQIRQDLLSRDQGSPTGAPIPDPVANVQY